MKYHKITVLFHAIESTLANTLDATYSGRMMARLDVNHIVEFATAFL